MRNPRRRSGQRSLPQQLLQIHFPSAPDESGDLDTLGHQRHTLSPRFIPSYIGYRALPCVITPIFQEIEPCDTVDGISNLVGGRIVTVNLDESQRDGEPRNTELESTRRQEDNENILGMHSKLADSMKGVLLISFHAYL